MNDLNTKLQGSNQLINKLYLHINAFKRTLKLLEKKIPEKNFMEVNRLTANQSTDKSIYMNFIQNPRQKFET